MSVNSHHSDGLQGLLGVYVYVFDALRIQNRQRKALGERDSGSAHSEKKWENVFTATAVA